jgi:hypothetical protein
MDPALGITFLLKALYQFFRPSQFFANFGQKKFTHAPFRWIGIEVDRSVLWQLTPVGHGILIHDFRPSFSDFCM